MKQISTFITEYRVFPTGGWVESPSIKFLFPPHQGHANFDFNWCSVFTEKHESLA